MKKTQNIWIVFSSRKGGHTYPSKALYDYIKEKAKNCSSPQIINLLDFSPSVSFVDKIGRYGDLKLKSLYKRGYQNLQEENQILLGSYRLAESILFNISKIYDKLLFRFGKADIIVSIQPEVNVIAHMLKNRFAVPIHTIIIDLAIHGLWVNKWIDHYYVANKPLRNELIKYKIDPKKISVTGIPLRNGFTQIVHSDVKQIKNRLKISTDLPTVLLMGGLLGTMIDFHTAIQSIVKMNLPIQLIVIFGRNEEQRIKAKLLKQQSKWPIHLLGTVSNVDELMWASDLIVSKPGSVTMAEALSFGKPMVVITPRAGSAQELRFARFLEENGAGEWINSVQQLGMSVSKILNSQKTYEAMCKKAWELGHHSLNATEKIFENVKKSIKRDKEEKQ